MTFKSILLSCVFTLSQTFPTRFKPEKSTNLLKLTMFFIWFHFFPLFLVSVSWVWYSLTATGGWLHTVQTLLAHEHVIFIFLLASTVPIWNWQNIHRRFLTFFFWRPCILHDWVCSSTSPSPTLLFSLVLFFFLLKSEYSKLLSSFFIRWWFSQVPEVHHFTIVIHRHWRK